jgi:hypothetical protein
MDYFILRDHLNFDPKKPAVKKIIVDVFPDKGRSKNLSFSELYGKGTPNLCLEMSERNQPYLTTKC